MSSIRTPRVCRAIHQHALAALLHTLGAGCALAQAPAPTDTQATRAVAPAMPGLTLAALYERLDQRSPRLAAARLLADAAAHRVAGAGRPADPQLQLGVMNYRLPALAPMAVLGMQQLQLMQMVPVGGKLGLGAKVAESRAVAARARADDVRWEQRSRVAMAFYELYKADRAARIADETRRLLRDVAATAQSMYAVGDGAQGDILRARVEVARMTEDIVRMQAMRVAMASRLNGLLDEPLDTAIAEPILPALPDSLPPVAALIREADANRAMIRAGEAEVQGAMDAERLARRELWPDLVVGVQVGQQRGDMGTERMGSLMLGATLPVFARDRQLQMRSEAAAMRAMARADVAAMRAETRARVAELHADFTRARNLRALYRTTVLPQAQAAVSASLAAYRVGSVNLMTLLDNQMTVNRYRQELFALDAEAGTAIAELEMLVGRELIDANSRAAREGNAP